MSLTLSDTLIIYSQFSDTSTLMMDLPKHIDFVSLVNLRAKNIVFYNSLWVNNLIVNNLLISRSSSLNSMVIAHYLM